MRGFIYRFDTTAYGEGDNIWMFRDATNDREYYVCEESVALLTEKDNHRTCFADPIDNGNVEIHWKM